MLKNAIDKAKQNPNRCSRNPQESRKKEAEMQNSKKTRCQTEMSDFRVSAPNRPIKGQKLAKWIKNGPMIWCLRETHF